MQKFAECDHAELGVPSLFGQVSRNDSIQPGQAIRPQPLELGCQAGWGVAGRQRRTLAVGVESREILLREQEGHPWREDRAFCVDQVLQALQRRPFSGPGLAGEKIGGQRFSQAYPTGWRG
jgi:hypothetical protein